MSYVMEYAKEINPNDEIIEDKGVKVFVDAAASYVSYLELKWIIKKRSFHHHLYSITLMNLSVVVVESHLKFNITYSHISIANYRISMYKLL